MDPITNGVDAINPVPILAELLVGKIQKFIRIAIPTGERITQRFGRQLVDRDRRSDRPGIIDERRDRDDRVVMDSGFPGLQDRTVGEVPVKVLEMKTGKRRVEGELFRGLRTSKIAVGTGTS
jgi:hypothetical protein